MKDVRKKQAMEDFKRGKIDFKEMVKRAWNLSDVNYKREEERVVVLVKTPKVEKTVQDRMDWINN